MGGGVGRHGGGWGGVVVGVGTVDEWVVGG